MNATRGPLVSIIVPVYNSQRFLRHCLDSIVGQTYRNLQIILVDDGSTDTSGGICDEYAAQDQRIEVIHHNNGGIAKAQNTGLDAARGDYIAFADNDDILDARNIELLLHALVTTGADMSKARWRQFGVSQMDAVTAEAAKGASAPGHITVFEDPLRAYQSVFCKSLRIAGDLLGRKSEARYFNEANWCRLYRAELWSGVRFPEGMYAQDTAIAGEVYIRMHAVADIDVNLYNWLQQPQSVTHRKHAAAFYHDHVTAALHNMEICRRRHLTPARSYYTLIGNLHYETKAASQPNTAPQDAAIVRHDRDAADKAISMMTKTEHTHCDALRLMRLLEKAVYDRKIKNMS